MRQRRMRGETLLARHDVQWKARAHLRELRLRTHGETERRRMKVETKDKIVTWLGRIAVGFAIVIFAIFYVLLAAASQ